MKQILGACMVALSLFVLWSVFGSEYSGGEPVIPALVPVFGLWFGIGYAIFQFLYCLIFRLPRGFLWIFVSWVCVAFLFPIVHLAAAFRDPEAIPTLTRVLVGAPVVSGIFLGIGVLRGTLMGKGDAE